MPPIAHLSDLHLGASTAHVHACVALVERLLELEQHHVIVSGDITHSGRIDEYETFMTLFAPLRRARRLTVVPGNHDRAGDDVASLLSDGLRVSVDTRPGLYLVCIDSTAPHNRSAWRSHGHLCAKTVDAVDRALDLAPRGSLVTVVLHHHLVRLPIEGFGEWFADTVGWPHAQELGLGKQLLQRVVGRADLVLHGHRHVPRHFSIEGPRPLQVFNAGSSTELRAFRTFELGAAPTWHAVSPHGTPQTPRAELRVA
ncbi:MAG: metallophosphoesterase [Archangium sp.]|nr:metallophosphoesterase [Archangium sp.]